MVPRYPNGEAPLDVLVSRPSASKDFCLMFPGTAVKYDRLVQLGRERYGWTPLVSGPDDAYRRLSVQIEYKRIYGGNAAAPGYSSHGGWFEGAETGALDIGNWGDIGQDAFYQLARDAGFVPGYFDWEPWHIIDYTPWDVPARPAPVTVPKEDDMKLKYWRNHAFLIGQATVWHVPDPNWLAYLEDPSNGYGPGKTIDDDALTLELCGNAVPWAAVDACLRGVALGNDGHHWSRLEAEGVEIRRKIDRQEKTLSDVVATAKTVPTTVA